MSDLLKYKKLSEIEHVIQRTGMYLGSTTNTTVRCFIPNLSGKMKEKELTYNPVLLKMFDEIVSNAADEHIRSGKISRIEVNINQLTGSIEIIDDGGIPVEIHPEYKTYIPSMIFSELRTGSNFNDDDRATGGLNGLGAKLTSIFSTEFNVETRDGKKKFSQTFRDNLSVIEPAKVISSNATAGTKIVFLPDYDRIGCILDEGNLDRITKRVYDVAGCNPKIDVYLNGEHIKVKKFDDYVSMYTDDFVSGHTLEWNVCVGASKDDTFRHVSFVNGVDTYNGGTHVDYITSQITAKLREHIKKKHKIEIKPNNIKQQLFLFVSCSINAPLFTSQTKECMSSDVKDFGTSYSVSDKFMNALLKSSIVENILDWAEAQQRKEELLELRKINKQTQNTNYLKKIIKFDDATSKNRPECSLLLVEGDSAAKAILSSRDPKKIGVYALKGKPLNVRDVKIKKLTANTELADLMAILGICIGKDYTIEDLRFSKLVLTTDADVDGAHICGLVINTFNEFWRNLIVDGLVYKLRTPLIVAKIGKTEYEFFTKTDYNNWNKKDQKHTAKYHKGLGGWSTKDFKRFLSDPKYLEPITYVDESDIDCVDLAFNKKRADDRKDWLAES